ncbi:hypothetical protein ACN9MY_09910 [Pseudoduganella sp. R-31]|uniref:hypothetical protein n=1 Tax=Pseudoduganella sp. R-31 TaxID=3404060 RepID=UPI003CF293C5
MKRILFAIILPFACCAAIANPADKSQRESEAMSERIKQGDNDKQRWARISLYSDSEAPEDLAMPLVKDAGLWMKLDPSRGHLEFSSKGSVQVFAIAAARNARRTVCSKYNLRVIDTSYLRNGAGNLTCIDNAATEGKGTEAGYCEGERPPLVTSRHVND